MVLFRKKTWCLFFNNKTRYGGTGDARPESGVGLLLIFGRG